MSLSKKKSRKIVIDGIEYRWSPSADSGYMVLVVQLSSVNGKKLEITIPGLRNIRVKSDSFLDFIEGEYLVITPKIVEILVRKSIHLGWNPYDFGAPVELSLVDDKLEIRRGL